MPHVQAQFYYPKAVTEVSVVQTLGCTPDGTKLVSAISVLQSTNYAADHAAPAPGAGALDYADIGGFLTDADLGMNFGAGHTLAGINASSTGQAMAVVKSAVALARAAGGVAAIRSQAAISPEAVETTCISISVLAAKAAAGASDKSYRPGATVSLTYTARLVYVNDAAGQVSAQPDPDGVVDAGQDGWKPGDPIPLAADPASATLLASLPILAQAMPTVRVVRSTLLEPNVAWSAGPSADRHFKAIKLNRVAEATLEVDGPGASLLHGPVPIWRGAVSTPVQLYYDLPVPKGIAFGKQGLALTLNPDGSIAKLEYTANTGLADAADTAAAVLKALPQSQTTTDQAKADAIYEHQRLIQCETTRSCPSK
ncbi:MAG TPA: hypothetical protein VIC25_03420 [Caulobacteraceae bacterium]